MGAQRRAWFTALPRPSSPRACHPIVVVQASRLQIAGRRDACTTKYRQLIVTRRLMAVRMLFSCKEFVAA